MKIVILEPGAWGTALGILLSRKNEVNFWYKDKDVSRKLSRARENERLSGIKIPEKISISSNLKESILGNDLVIIASPSFNFRKTLLQLKNCGNLVSATSLLGIAKGIERETLKLPSQIVEEIFPGVSYAHLSGPGFAGEIIRGKEAEEVIASKNKSFLKKLKNLFQVKPLKILITADLVGVQIAGATKNALAVGISLVEAKTRPDIKKIRSKLIRLGLNEMIKIGAAAGGKRKTFVGPAGLGDLILTSTNPLSRNFQFGKNLVLNAEKTRQDIKKRKITVEGFNNNFALYRLGKIHKIDLPMINETYKAIYGKTSPEKTIENLINLAG